MTGLIGQQIGPFLIEKELGSGAMGTVFRAHFDKTGQPVALKVVSALAAANASALARFDREAAILKQLKHPHIVRWVGTGRYRGMPFIAMEYVRGETLDKALARRGRFAWPDVVALGKQLCDALAHAHEKGILHRDLKPANLMITEDGVLKLTDFGIAKDTDETTLTGTNCAVGTAAYMSPEQCRGERHLTGKTDLYSLGVVFYELLTGDKPFKAESPVEMFMAHVKGTFVRPARLVPDIPIWLDNLVCQMLEKKPDHRPLDAAMVGRALAEVEEKVASQHSAGQDAAKTRVGERVYQNDVTDDRDRAAAKTIKAGAKRKKTADYREPALPMAAVFALAAAGGLLAGGLVWLALRPADPGPAFAAAEKAIAEARAAEGDGRFEALGKALGPVQSYVSSFGSRGDDKAARAQAWQEELLSGRKDVQLFNRFRKNFGIADGDFEPAAKALEDENKGDFDSARRRWRDLAEKRKDAADPDNRAWAWLAERKQKELDEVPKRAADLAARVEKESVLGQDVGAATDAERRMAEVLRLERFGDVVAARDRANRAVEEFGRQPGPPRAWALAAARKAAELAAKVPPTDPRKERDERLAFARGRADEAKALLASADERKGELLARDVVRLYRGDPDPDFAALAKDAEARLRAAGKPVP